MICKHIPKQTCALNFFILEVSMLNFLNFYCGCTTLDSDNIESES